MSEPTPPGPPLGPPPGWHPPPLSQPPPAPATPRRGLQLLVVGLSLLAALLVVAVALVLPRVVDDLTDDGSAVVAGGGEAAGEGSDAGDEQAPVGLDDVLVVEDLDPEHRIDEDIEYDQVPPIGGPHDAEWLACGAYDEPVRDENVVHDLEHGTVWITHDPDLAADDLAVLEGLLPDNGILSPYPDLPAPAVVTVWGVQLELSGADDPRLPLFIEEYGDGSTAPEPFASCEGGVENPQGDQGGATV